MPLLANIGSGEVACPVIEGAGVTAICGADAEPASRVPACLDATGVAESRGLLPVVHP